MAWSKLFSSIDIIASFAHSSASPDLLRKAAIRKNCNKKECTTTRQLDLLFLLRLLLYLYKYKTLIIPQNTWSAFALSPCSSNIIPKLWNGSEHFGTKAKKLQWFNAYSSSVWYWYNTSQASWQYWIHYFMNQVSRIKFRMQDTILHFILNTLSSMGALYCMMLPQVYTGM